MEIQDIIKDYQIILNSLGDIEVKGNNVDKMYAIKLYINGKIKALNENKNNEVQK